MSASAGPCTVNFDAGGSNDMWLFEVTSGLSRPPTGVTPFLHKTTNNAGNSTTADPGALTPSFLDVFMVSCATAFLKTITAGTAGWAFYSFAGEDGTQTLIPTSIAPQDGSFTVNSAGNWKAAQASFAFTNTNVAGVAHARPKPFLV